MNFVVFFQHNTHACHDLEANPPEIRGSKHEYLLCSKSGEFFEIRPQHPITRTLVLVLPVLNFHLPVRPTDAAALGQNTTAGTTRCRRWEITVTFVFELGRGQNGTNTGNRKWRIGRNSALCRIAELGSYVDSESLFGVILFWLGFR